MLWVKGMGGKNESHSPDYSVYHSPNEGNKRVLIEGCRSLLCMYQVGCTCLCVMCDVWGWGGWGCKSPLSIQHSSSQSVSHAAHENAHRIV